MMCALITALLALPGGLCGAGDEGDLPAALEAFRKNMQLTEKPEAQAALILEFGRPGREDLVSALAPHLSPKPADPHAVLPLATLTTLSAFRGSAAASKALLRALPSFEGNPFLLSAAWKAIARVGHASALPLFQAEIQNKDPGRATRGIRKLAGLPAHLSLPALFEEQGRLERRLLTATNAEKGQITAVQTALLAEVRRISGERYPSMKEMEIWFKRRGPDFIEQARKAEEQERSAARDPGASAPALPPLLLVDLGFNDLDGALTSNLGLSANAWARARFSDPPPVWSGNQPTRSGGRSVDFGIEAGAKAVDLVAGRGAPLQGLTSFTLTGWISLQGESGDDDEGRPILSWLLDGKDGVELVYQRGGALQLGINERAHRSPAKTEGGLIPGFDKKTAGTLRPRDKWRFFAVTYDQGLAVEHVKFYIGSWGGAAQFAKSFDYNRGSVGPKASPVLSVGNVNLSNRPAFPGRSFPGLIDEIRIFGSRETSLGALTLEGIQEVQRGTEAD